jgi:hypothetical protein
MRSTALLLLALLLCFMGQVRRASHVLAADEIFTEVTAEAGIHWRHVNGESPQTPNRSVERTTTL